MTAFNGWLQLVASGGDARRLTKIPTARGAILLLCGWLAMLSAAAESTCTWTATVDGDFCPKKTVVNGPAVTQGPVGDIYGWQTAEVVPPTCLVAGALNPRINLYGRDGLVDLPPDYPSWSCGQACGLIVGSATVAPDLAGWPAMLHLDVSVTGNKIGDVEDYYFRISRNGVLLGEVTPQSGPVDVRVVAGEELEFAAYAMENDLSGQAGVVSYDRAFQFSCIEEVHTPLLVPSQYPTIQAAIDAAWVGDVVMIADGVYTGAGNKELDFGGKDIVVRSASYDPNKCVIDCEGSGRGFYFYAGEADVRVGGLTIRNGNAADRGGGVLCENVGVVAFEDCRFEDNEAPLGAGLCVVDSIVTVDICTFTGNAGSDGGGVACSDSTMFLGLCRFTDNTALYAGGGLYAEDGAAVSLGNCTITDNQADWAGGGVYVDHASLILDTCVLARNGSLQGGGAYSCSSSTLIASYCSIIDNTAGFAAGLYIEQAPAAAGMMLSGDTAAGLSAAVTVDNWSASNAGRMYYASSYPRLVRRWPDIRTLGSAYLSLTDCRITGNTASQSGGGIMCADASPVFSRCFINGNVANDGGGLYCSGSLAQPVLKDCAIANNRGMGAAVLLTASASPSFINCTFAQNTADPSTGAVACYSNSNAQMTNCILWGDTPREIYLSAASSTVMYSDVRGGWPGVGNFDADPLFRDPDGADDDPDSFEDNDYRLLPGSPCIDTGSNAAVVEDAWVLDGDEDTAEPLPIDLSGRARLMDDPATADCPWAPHTCGMPPIVDVGAYEYQRDGDCDLNWVIDAADAAQLVACLGAQGVTPQSGCVCSDADVDGDVDLRDFSLLQAEVP